MAMSSYYIKSFPNDGVIECEKNKMCGKDCIPIVSINIYVINRQNGRNQIKYGSEQNKRFNI